MRCKAGRCEGGRTTATATAAEAAPTSDDVTRPTPSAVAATRTGNPDTQAHGTLNSHTTLCSQRAASSYWSAAPHKLETPATLSSIELHTGPCTCTCTCVRRPTHASRLRTRERRSRRWHAKLAPRGVTPVRSPLIGRRSLILAARGTCSYGAAWACRRNLTCCQPLRKTLPRSDAACDALASPSHPVPAEACRSYRPHHTHSMHSMVASINRPPTMQPSAAFHSSTVVAPGAVSQFRVIAADLTGQKKIFWSILTRGRYPNNSR